MKSLILHDHEVRRLLDIGSVTVVREVRLPGYTIDERDDGLLWPYRMSWAHGDPDGSEWAACPHGAPGERRWVRETWGLPHAFDTDRSPQAPRDRVHYAATAGLGGPRGLGGLICRSAAQMPRWASRAVVEVASVRVARLRDLTADDAMAAGVEDWQTTDGRGSWDANPLVWVVEFAWLLNKNAPDWHYDSP